MAISEWTEGGEHMLGAKQRTFVSPAPVEADG